MVISWLFEVCRHRSERGFCLGSIVSFLFPAQLIDDRAPEERGRKHLLENMKKFRVVEEVMKPNIRNRGVKYVNDSQLIFSVDDRF